MSGHSGVPRLTRALDAVIDATDMPHLMMKGGRLSIVFRPEGLVTDMQTLMPFLNLDHQKGDFAYCWLLNKKDERAVNIYSGFTVLTGGYFAVVYKGNHLKPWGEHVDRLSRMLRYWPVSKEQFT